MCEKKLKHVFCMPGMAASSNIFENILLPENYKLHLLEWKAPLKNENLTDYARRIADEITEIKPILLGVSFGGVVVQEIAKFIDYEKIILVSSVKSNQEFPKRMQIARQTKLHKLLPTAWIRNSKIGNFFSAISKKFSKKRKLYKKYMYLSSTEYLDWAINQIINWKQTTPLPRTIHIQGDNDWVFPIKNIKNAIIVRGGTHIMIINRYRWFNENLPQIIES